jgi:RNA polymerase sigma-70 factor (ECF subfamily)
MKTGDEMEPSPAPRADTPDDSCNAATRASSEKLIKRIANSDQLAMRALFARHRASVHRWLVCILHDESLADDVLNDVFLDISRHAVRFDERSATWLMAIARTKALLALHAASAH